MKFESIRFPEVIRVTLDPNEDDRGSFTRIYCQEIWKENGLCSNWDQMNQSVSAFAGTTRGLHFQRAPFGEIKMIRCVRGSAMDYFVDLREGSETFGQWGSFELRADEPSLIYLPYGFGHGFQTLEDDTSLLYWHSCPYSPSHQGGVRFEDVGIEFALPVTSISDRDQTFAPISEMEPLKP